MTSPFRRLVGVLILFVVSATACSSSDGTQVAADGADADAPAPTLVDDQAGDAADGQAGDAADDPAFTDTDADPGATSIPVPADDSAADAAIAGLDGDTADNDTPEVANADRGTTATDFVRNRFNIDPEPEWVSCVVGQATNDEVLDRALQLPSVGQGQVDDAQLKAITIAMNGCVDSIGLGDWATQAVGPRGEIAETAPACFAERFDDEATGDATFSTFVALTYQFRIDPAAVPDLIDALVTCAPIQGLTEFFATSEEQGTNFATVIDRDCLNETISDPAISEEFWTTFVEGGTPPATVMQPYLASCQAAANDDFADSVPDDFVAWSGTGALANVSPAARQNVYSSQPPMTIDPSANYEAVFVTGGGEVRIQLFADTAPLTVNNFVNLARDGYFDGTVFHRVLDGFMAQGGDPTGTGTGGPGYSFADEFESDRSFDKPGILAMANSGPATNGSQFFITFVETDWLTGAHTIFGEVTQGYDLVEVIERRDPAAPSGRGQVLESVTIIES